MINIQISGFDTIKKRALEAAKVLEKWNEEATNANIVDLKNKASQRAPYKTGQLRRSIAERPTNIKTENGVTTGDYGSDLPYARIYELGGTIPAHVVKVKNRKVLTNGVDFFGASANIPARYVAARPYLFPTLVENIDLVLSRYKMAYEKGSSEIESIQ